MKRAVPAVIAALALAACGDGNEENTATERDESPSLAPTPESTPSPEATPPTATAPSAPPPPLDATGPEDQPGGAGDEEPIRTRVSVVIDGEGVTPPRVDVPAFLSLRITVRNDLARRVTVALRGGHGGVRVRARGRRSFTVGGLQRGEYPLDAGAAGRGLIRAR